MSNTELKRQARECAEERGHEMTNFSKYTHAAGFVYIAHCRRCDKTAIVRPEPMPNEIESSGEALALNCPRPRPQRGAGGSYPRAH